MAAAASVESHVVVADRAALDLARRQHGVITLAQLFLVGFSRGAVRQRLAQGWLRRLHRGVFLVGAVEPTLARAMAATLACGDGALLSHYSAAVLWGLRPSPAEVMHVTVVGRNIRGPENVRVHRLHALHHHDATRRQAIPVTSPTRTLLDLATHLPPQDLGRAAEEAQVRHLVTDHSLDEQFQRYPKHRGTAALRKAIRSEPALTRSEAERRFLKLIRRARLPEPRTNVRIGRYEVDFYWPERDLIVEIDGYAFHSSRGAFERDRRRDAELGAQGQQVMRVTWRRLVDESEALVANLALATAGGRAGRGTRRRGAGRAGAA